MVNDDVIPNGLLLNKATSLVKVLNHDRWSQAEARTVDLLENIQPSHASEMRRNDVVFYLRNLIMNRLPCQVFRVGSVPLKTYLPDGDIDLTAFGEEQDLKDNFIPEVLVILKNEENNKNAEFQVKEVQCIPAEVKIIKCMVENFVVDISFHQLEGLSTLCFLEEVDDHIRHNHLFKRSIILIKAWCYHESRILGSHYGLLSSYGLEILVLYIFHLYNNQFVGPLEVLYRFLDFFSKFDWENYCISLRGPVPKGSLPDMRAQPPRKNFHESLFNDTFFDACISCYAMIPSSQEDKEQSFAAKYMNIIDPLRANNNLGRNISKSNFFRIRSAISYGAEQLVRLLDCSEDDLLAHLDYFFRNTWARHGSGYWMDYHSYNLYIRNNNVEKSTSHEQRLSGTSNVSAVSQTRSKKNKGISTGKVTSDIVHKGSMKDNALTNKGKNPKYSSNDEVQAMHNFSGVCSSSGEIPTQHSASSMTGNSMMLMHQEEHNRTYSQDLVPLPESLCSPSSSSYKVSQPEEVRGDNLIPHSTAEAVASSLQALKIDSSSSRQGPMSGSNMNAESDPLSSDFACYWLNLSYARLCQNAQSEGDFRYDPSVIPPFYLRDNRLRKKSSRFLYMMAHHGAPLVAEMINQYGDQPLGFWLPRITGGTGTFLPNPPNPVRYYEMYNRKRLLHRLYQGNNIYEGEDSEKERERIWNHYSRERFPR